MQALQESGGEVPETGSKVRAAAPAAVPGLLAGLGAFFVLLGGWAAVDSGSFSSVLADFGPENSHLVHDFGAASSAIGTAMLVAAWLPTWRAPVLAVAALWNGLHAISHLADLGEAASFALGVTEAALLVGAAALFTLLATRSARVARGTE